MSHNSKNIGIDKEQFHKKLLEEFKGDEEILCKMIGIYHKKSGQYLSSLEESITKNEAVEIVHSSHLFKGAIGNFTVDSPFKILRKIEYLAKNKDLEAIPQLLEELKPQLVELNSALTDLKTNLSKL
ncbi:MAG: Hpt domain-containing protein [Oligoflexales bacterium]